MARASDTDLDRIETVLKALRALPDVTEKARGVFYRGRNAFVHFHREGEDIFADAKTHGRSFTRYPLASQAERAAFVAAVRRAV